MTGMWVVYYTILSTFNRFIFFKRKELKFKFSVYSNPGDPWQVPTVQPPFRSDYCAFAARGPSAFKGRFLSLILSLPLPPISLQDCPEHIGPVLPTDLWREGHSVDHHSPRLDADDELYQFLFVSIISCGGFKTWSQNSLALIPRDGAYDALPLNMGS